MAITIQHPRTVNRLLPAMIAAGVALVGAIGYGTVLVVNDDGGSGSSDPVRAVATETVRTDTAELAEYATANGLVGGSPASLRELPADSPRDVIQHRATSGAGQDSGPSVSATSQPQAEPQADVPRDVIQHRATSGAGQDSGPSVSATSQPQAEPQAVLTQSSGSSGESLLDELRRFETGTEAIVTADYFPWTNLQRFDTATEASSTEAIVTADYFPWTNLERFESGTDGIVTADEYPWADNLRRFEPTTGGSHPLAEVNNVR